MGYLLDTISLNNFYIIFKAKSYLFPNKTKLFSTRCRSSNLYNNGNFKSNTIENKIKLKTIYHCALSLLRF